MLTADITDPLAWELVVNKATSESDQPSVERLSFIVDVLRNAKAQHRTQALEALCDYLESAPVRANTLKDALCDVVTRSDATFLLTESGIQGNEGFVRELFNRVERRFLPEIEASDDLRLELRTLFYNNKDYLWVKEIPDALWVRLVTVLGIGKSEKIDTIEEWATSLRILSHHVASLGLQPEITHRLTHLDDADSPFLQLSDDVSAYIRAVQEGVDTVLANRRLDVALQTVKTCQAQVDLLRKEKGRYGTSLRLTSLSARLVQLLNRIACLLMLSAAGKEAFRFYLISLFKEVLEAENRRDHITPHVKKSGDLLAFQVVEHAAKKGSKYITADRKEYWLFFAASLGGGLLVALFAVMKLLLKRPEVPLGIEALLYGINYSVCFVMIYMTGSALATKQPAMTANTLARSLERSNEGIHLERLVELIVRVWRSQFISFVGNLLMAMPVAFSLSLLYHYVKGVPIVDGATSTKMLEGMHPLGSGALIYAGIAGIFLFISGLVAGWVDNRNLFQQYPKRIASHPRLIRWVGALRAQRIGAFWEKNLGILAGNIVLGFCLGSTATVGKIIGLPIDIRHIAFSSAEFGISLEVLGSTAVGTFIVNAALGVVLIGLVNFLVSFGLSLAMALESRSVRFGETRRLLGMLGRRLIKKPIDWFFPPRQ